MITPKVVSRTSKKLAELFNIHQKKKKKMYGSIELNERRG